MISIPLEKGQNTFIDVIGKILTYFKVSCTNARHGNEGHHGPVSAKDGHQGHQSSFQIGETENQGSKKIAKSYALQDPKKSDLFDSFGKPSIIIDSNQVSMRERMNTLRSVLARLLSHGAVQAENDGDTRQEHKQRKNAVIKGQPLPFFMTQLFGRKVTQLALEAPLRAWTNSSAPTIQNMSKPRKASKLVNRWGEAWDSVFIFLIDRGLPMK